MEWQRRTHLSSNDHGVQHQCPLFRVSYGETEGSSIGCPAISPENSTGVIHVMMKGKVILDDTLAGSVVRASKVRSQLPKMGEKDR